MVDLQNGYWMIKSMVGWQYFVMWLMPVIGAALGGVLGYLKRENQKFNWKLFAATVVSGIIGGGLFLWVVAWIHAPFHGALMVLGLIVGIGFDFLVKKIPTVG